MDVSSEQIKMLTYYRQTREDGGVRAGIDADDTELLHHFSPGEEEHDPALTWWVDLRCKGSSLPHDPAGAREWFRKHGSFFVTAMQDVADKRLIAGFDADLWPYRREIADAPDGARVEIVISAVRRLVARDIAEVLRQFARNWDTLLDQLEPLSVV